MMTSCCHCVALRGSYKLKYASPFQIILPFGAAKEGKADIFSLWAIEVTTLVGVFLPKKQNISCFDRPTEIEVAVMLL